MSTISGGIVSLSPPLGGVVVFAQELDRKICPSASTAGTRGKYLYISDLSFILSDYVVPHDGLYPIHALELGDEVVQHGLAWDI